MKRSAKGLVAAAALLLAGGGIAPISGSGTSVLIGTARASDLAASLRQGQMLYARLLMSLKPTMDNGQLGQLMDLADSALEAAPNNQDARLLKAGAIWLKSRQTGKMMSFLKGYPQTSFKLLTDVVKSAPSNARGHAYLACWHIDIFRRGGASGAKRLGADLATGLAEWDKAVALAPDEIPLMVHGAYTLLASSDPGAQKRGAHALELAVNAKASDPLAVALQQRAQKLSALLKAGNQAQGKAEIASWVGP